MYYKFGTFVFARVKNFLTISLNFPLTSTADQFHLYEIDYLAQPVLSQPRATMILRDRYPGIAICKQCNLFYFLSERDIAELRIMPNQAMHRRVFEKLSMRVYLLAIYYDRVEHIKQNCNYEIILNSM